MFSSCRAADAKDKISTARLSEIDLAPSVSAESRLRIHSDPHAYEGNQTEQLCKSDFGFQACKDAFIKPTINSLYAMM